MWVYNYSNQLTHHGVLGMKWGRRRFQNEDGSLTRVGKNRYNREVEQAKGKLSEAKGAYKKATQDYNSETLGGMVYNSASTKKLATASNDVKYAKRELSDAKTKAKIEGQTKKSDRQLKFEQKYKGQGLTPVEAEIAAYKRVRTEKIIAVTAGVAVTAVAAYVAYKHYDNNVDKIIKAGTQLQNISTNSNKGVSDAFYASMNKMDNAKYRGIYGAQLKTDSSNGLPNAVYETKIGVNSSLKLASKKSATQALGELVKSDKTYANNLEVQLKRLYDDENTPKQNKVILDALKTLKSGKVDSKVYDALNLTLAEHSPTGQAVSKGFYDLLKSKGYDAIKDINDSKYSGYESRNPIIVFNGASKTAVNRIRELGAQEINKNMGIANVDIVGRDVVKRGSAYAAATFGVAAAAKAIESKSNSKIVKDHRREHPESTMSYNEILKSYKQESIEKR